MEEKTWKKLVRDNIVPDLERRGIICLSKFLNEKEMMSALADKILEEINEVEAANTEPAILEEIADVLTVTRELKVRVERLLEQNQNSEILSTTLLRQKNYCEQIEFIYVAQANGLGCDKDQLEILIGSKQMVKGGFKNNCFLISTLENKKDLA